MIDFGVDSIALVYNSEEGGVDLFNGNNKVQLNMFTSVGYSPRINVKFLSPDNLNSQFIYGESNFNLAIRANEKIISGNLQLVDSDFEGSSMTLMLAPSRNFIYESLFDQIDDNPTKVLTNIYSRYFKDVDNQAKEQSSAKMKWTSLGNTPSKFIIDVANHNTEPILSGINFDDTVTIRDLSYYKSNKDIYTLSQAGLSGTIKMTSPLLGSRRESCINSYNNDFLQMKTSGDESLKSAGKLGRNLLGYKFLTKNVFSDYYTNNQKCLKLLGKLASECWSCNVIDLVGLKLLDAVAPLANEDNSNNDYLGSRAKRCIITGMRYTYNSEHQNPQLIKTLYMNPIDEVLDEL